MEYQTTEANPRCSHLQKAGACAASLLLVASCAMPALAYAEGDPGSGGQGGMSAQGGMGGEGGGAGGGGGANTQTFDYSGSYSAALSADAQEASASSGETVTSSTANENAALVQNSGVLTIEGATLQKSGDSSDSDNCNFYGVNSILLGVGSGSTAYVTSAVLSATSEGSNGIFATDSATVLANSTQITTESDNSRGLDATYAGTILAGDMTISTAGGHSASVATDRGGGYVSVANSTLNTSGEGSPLLYSTGAIEVGGVMGTATGSQIAAMEGLNTIQIYSSDLTSTVTGVTASEPVANGVLIYQSTSGDADTSTGEAALFQAVDSTLTSAIESGSMFYLTNTTANVVLQNTTLAFDSTAANLVTAAGNDSNNWGSAGSNGATVSFTGINQQLSGTVEADTISSVDLYLLEGSTWSGTTSIVENSAGSTVDNPITVNVDSTSTWTVTESCTLSNLNAASGAKIVDASGNTVTIVAGGETVVEGTSDITVTVTGSYSTEVSTSDAQQVSDPSVDRSSYDSYYNTSTTLNQLSGSTASASSSETSTASSTTTTESTETENDNFFVGIWKSILGFFGL